MLTQSNSSSKLRSGNFNNGDARSEDEHFRHLTLQEDKRMPHEVIVANMLNFKRSMLSKVSNDQEQELEATVVHQIAYAEFLYGSYNELTGMSGEKSVYGTICDNSHNKTRSNSNK